MQLLGLGCLENGRSEPGFKRKCPAYSPSLLPAFDLANAIEERSQTKQRRSNTRNAMDSTGELDSLVARFIASSFVATCEQD